MACRYHYTEEQRKELEEAIRKNKEKRIDRRLRALKLRSEGKIGKEIGLATGYNSDYARRLEVQYIKSGITKITGNNNTGNRRNMSFAEEEELLAPFKEQAEKGELVEVSVIEAAYREAVGHSRVYLASGVSGTINHVTGFTDSDLVIAVNSDPDAPIFHCCDYGLVADMDETCDALLRAME